MKTPHLLTTIAALLLPAAFHAAAAVNAGTISVIGGTMDVPRGGDR